MNATNRNANNYVVGYGLILLVVVMAAFMPWASIRPPAVFNLFGQMTSSVSITGNAFKASLSLGSLSIPAWLATLAVLVGGLVGMLNAKGVTTLPRLLVIVPFVGTVGFCGVSALVFLEGRGAPRAGLLLTMFCAGAAALLCLIAPTGSPGRVTHYYPPPVRQAPRHPIVDAEIVDD